MKKDLYVITGCDSGIGRRCAELLLQKEKNLAISYLSENPFKAHPLCRAFKTDMTKEGDIAKFAGNIKKLCEKEFSLRCFFSNAGVALGGPVENVPLATFRMVFEINYFSYVSLIQKLIPILREGKGMIMMNGSLAGRIALPFLAPYASSKYALEGFADSLRRELNPFDIKTVLVEPAAVATPIWEKARKIDSSFIDRVYQESVNLFLENFVDSGSRGMPVDKAAAEIVRLMDAKRPKARYIISGTPFNSFLQTVLPYRIVDRLVKKFFRMNYS